MPVTLAPTNCIEFVSSVRFTKHDVFFFGKTTGWWLKKETGSFEVFLLCVVSHRINAWYIYLLVGPRFKFVLVGKDVISHTLLGTS